MSRTRRSSSDPSTSEEGWGAAAANLGSGESETEIQDEDETKTKIICRDGRLREIRSGDDDTDTFFFSWGAEIAE